MKKNKICNIRLFLSLLTIITLCSFQVLVQPEKEIGKRLPEILTQNQYILDLIGHSDSTLKYINPDTELITKYFIRKDTCYKIELYYQNVSMEQIGRKYILNDWTDVSLYKFSKGKFEMNLVERSPNYPVATITKLK